MKRLGLIAVLCVCATSAAAKQRNDGYILRLDSETRISSLDVQTLLAVDESVHGPVLWVQRDGRRYEIRDPSILARAAEAFRPLTKINKAYKAFESRARPVYKEEEDLDREIDAIEEGEHPAEARLAELRRERRELAQRLRAVEAEDRELDARQESAEAVFERILDDLIDGAIREGQARRIE